jgi:hypothetical protein
MTNLSRMRTEMAVGAAIAALAGMYFLRQNPRNKQRQHKDQVTTEGSSMEQSDDIPREVQLNSEQDEDASDKIRVLTNNTITIVHASVTGTCAKFALQIQQTLAQNPTFASTTIQIGKVEEWDWWDELLNKEDQATTHEKLAPVVILILPTHAGGAWPVGADDLQRALQELRSTTGASSRRLYGRLDCR